MGTPPADAADNLASNQTVTTCIGRLFPYHARTGRTNESDSASELEMCPLERTHNSDPTIVSPIPTPAKWNH